MSLIDRFNAYAEAFEQTYADDDWSRLEQFFAEDAVYETSAPFEAKIEGRAAVLDHLKNSINGFDRRFESRVLDVLEGPSERDGAVQITWAGTYAISGAPEVRMGGKETATYDGDRIKILHDEFDADTGTIIGAWLQEHGGKLPGA